MIDLVDPNPHEETTPPELAFEPLTEIQTVDPYASEDLTLAVTASATDAADAIESVTVETCWEDPPGDVREEQDRECQSAPIVSDAVDSDAIDTQLPSASSVGIPFSLYYYDDGTRIPDAPDEITVTAVDDDGTAVETHVDTVEREVEATASIQAAGAGAVQNVRTAQVTMSLPSAAQAGFFAQLTLVAGGALALDAAAESVGEDVQSGTAVHEEFHAVPGTEVQGQWELPEHGVEVTLPSGATYEHPADGEYVRGYGLEYIQATTPLTEAELDHAIRNPSNVIEENGEVRYVIGDGQSEIEKVILGIIGGTLATASQSTAYNEDCGSTVRLDKGENPDHATRDGKPVDEVTTLIEVIEAATVVVDAGQKRYYILKLGENRVVMAATNLLDDTYQVLKTTLTGDGPNNAFTSIDDALAAINGEYRFVHDERSGIDC